MNNTVRHVICRFLEWDVSLLDLNPSAMASVQSTLLLVEFLMFLSPAWNFEDNSFSPAVGTFSKELADISSSHPCLPFFALLDFTAKTGYCQ